jgi:salicylate hydroxylase
LRPTNVLIVGAGIGGLAAALALQRAGQRVRVFEQAPDLREVGAGLSITPNAGRALTALGLRAELERIGSTPRIGALRHHASDETLVTLAQDQSLERYGISLFHVHRADLHSTLARAVSANDANAIELGKNLVGLREDGSRIQAEFADSSNATGDWIVGCDGIRSRVRVELFGEEAPRFTGFVAWRGLVEAEQLPQAALEPPLCMALGPRRMLMRYPLRGGKLINIVAIARRAAWTEEGWSVRAELSELLDEFRDFSAANRAILAAIPADQCFKWGLFDRDPLPTWTRGRSTLLGDAAHPMPPFTGQGAVLALEDAVILGRAAAESNSLDEALRRYELARLPRATHVLGMSRDRADLYFADDPQAQARLLGAGMAELRTLYDYDAGTAQI